MPNVWRLKNVALNCMKSSSHSESNEISSRSCDTGQMREGQRLSGSLTRSIICRPGQREESFEGNKMSASEPFLVTQDPGGILLGFRLFVWGTDSMTFPFRILNWVFLVVTAVLEVVALVFLVKLIYTHCVLGGEYGISVWFYIYFLPGITAHSVVLAAFRSCWCTVGLDPIAVAFNLLSGLICIVASIVLLLAMWNHCGNEFTYMFYISTLCGLIAGFFHLINAIMCLVFMPPEEAHYLKPSKRRKKSLY